MLSLLLPPDVEAAGYDGPCKIFRSRVPECHHSRANCRVRCRAEGYSGGFCDIYNGRPDICLCTQCTGGQSSSPRGA
uniref:Knottin scorpion toxin-like domain-containing protein n=1 Tax=Arundo donax TaxID=35708 RepID=A0A0A9BN31_ARUDO